MGAKKEGANAFSSLLFLLLTLLSLHHCSAIVTITQSQNLNLGQTLTSPSQYFELGFFNISNSSKQYIGIWYRGISPRVVVWVANREAPLPVTDSAASLVIGSDGNLKLLDGKQIVFWSTNVSGLSNNTFAKLSDYGNLILEDGNSKEFLWESFKHPCDTILLTMQLGLNETSGEKRFITSWKSEDDPSPGNFVYRLALPVPVQLFIWNNSSPRWRSGQWDKTKFTGIIDMDSAYSNGIEIQQYPDQGAAYVQFSFFNITSFFSFFRITPAGSIELKSWDENQGEWITNWQAPNASCDIYGTCGPFGVCTDSGSPICSCLKGYVPQSNDEWKKGNWTGGCVRRTELLCEKNMTTGGGKEDWFLHMSGMKLPDNSVLVVDPLNLQNCQNYCLSNCSCAAFSFVDGIGCMIWTTGLVDVQQFSNSGEDLYIRLAYSESGKGKTRVKLIISVTVSLSIIIVGILMCCWWRWKVKKRGNAEETRIGFILADITDTSKRSPQAYEWRNSIKQGDSSELQLFEFDSISEATNHFSFNNKLGQGGFGAVYRGKLQDGQEIAVKRLSNSSGQGIEEFKNEILLISKLQHRNLVRLLGCSIEKEEKLLIYEYMSNKSLDTFLFDSQKRVLLDWGKRFNIIQGIARGLLYLHRDSLLRVIHRDLKVSNILLDEFLNPKISDFGLARTFQETQDLANTRRVVGTFGYMSPEYVMTGNFSEKSDVYSFGVLLLEIVTGKKNTVFHYNNQQLTLPGYAWQLWMEDRGLDLMDNVLAESFSQLEAMRCIHVGLLCGQDNAADRPTMADIVVMLSSETDRPQPKQSTFTFQMSLDSHHQSQSNTVSSKNEVTVSLVRGR